MKNLIKEATGNLDAFVTKVSEKNLGSRNLLGKMNSGEVETEKAQLIKNSVKSRSIPKYYMEGLHKALVKRGGDYFSNLYKVHFNQSLQFLNVKKGLNLTGYSPNGKKAVIPGCKKFISYNF